MIYYLLFVKNFVKWPQLIFIRKHPYSDGFLKAELYLARGHETFASKCLSDVDILLDHHWRVQNIKSS